MNEASPVKPGQVYKSLDDLYRFNTVRTLTVEHVGTPHPIYPGRKKLNRLYAWCLSKKQGKKPRHVCLEVAKLQSRKFKLVEPA